MKLIIATHNENKVNEFKKLLNEKVTVLSLSDLNDFEDIIEDGKTFFENSKIKSLGISNKYEGYFVLADDSGIEIEELNNLPGIYSARYSGGGDLANNLKVLSELEGKTNRKARFICHLTLAYNGKLLNDYLGVWEGTITNEIKGSNGFGYDSIFIPEGLNITAGEMDRDLKNNMSHRNIATLKFVNDFLNNKYLWYNILD